MSTILVKRLLILSTVIFLISSSKIFSQECQNFSSVHPDWILCEDWETGSIRTSIWNDYDTVTGNNSVITSEKYLGSYALRMIHPAGDSGGYLNSIGYPSGYNGPIGNGHKKLFARWYVRFANFPAGINTKIAGFDLRPDGLSSFWEDRLGAGYRPNGITSIGGSRVVNGPGAIEFYTYHPTMMLDRWSNTGSDVVCKYYGSNRPVPPGWVIGTPGSENGEDDYYCSPPGTTPWNEYSALMSLPHDTYSGDRSIGNNSWKCIEFELKVNDAGQVNGFQRLYLENTKVGEWTDISWTLGSVDGKIRGFQLTASSPTSEGTPLMYSYYDNIVLSTSRIGCIGAEVPPTDPDPTPIGDDNPNNDPVNNPDTNPSLDNNSEQTGVAVSSGCGLITDGDPVIFASLTVILAMIIFVYKRRNLI